MQLLTAAAPVPAAVPGGVHRADAAAGEPVVHHAGHEHRVGRLHVQELLVPGEPRQDRGALRLQGLLRPGRPGEGPVDAR